MPEEATDAHLAAYPGTYPLAIWAFVLAFLGPLIGLILGVIALRKLRQRRQRGSGLAQAAIIISALQVGLAVLAMIFLISMPDLRDDTGGVIQTREIAVSDVRTGDCILRHSVDFTGILEEVMVTPCAKLHSAEVFAVVEMPGERWPGEAAIEALVSDLCAEGLLAYAPGLDPAELEYWSLQPVEASWRRGDRTLICLADTPMTMGSIRER